MQQIKIVLWHNDEALDWSIEINGLGNEHVTSEIIEALVECALIVSEEEKPLSDLRGAAQRGSATASVPTGCVLYAVNGFFAGVPGIAECIAYSPFYLVNLAFGFKFLIAGDAPSKLLNLARHFICCTFHVLLVHVTPLPY
jgi:hypothetical protein